MGFMDKVKAQATTIAGKAQEQAKSGQEKLSQMQAKRQSDAMLTELGHIFYAERTGTADASSEARAAALVAQLKDFEAEHGPIQGGSADPPPGGSSSFVPGGAGPSDSGGMPTATHASDEEEPEKQG